MSGAVPSAIPVTTGPAGKKSGLATASLVLGILALPTLWLTGIPALITGHLALSRIRKSGGTTGGRGRALAGTILSYLSLIAVSFMMSLAGVKAIEQAKQAKVATLMLEIGDGLHQFHVENSTDTEPFPANLERLESMGLTPNLQRLLTLPKGVSGEWTYFWAADPDNGAAPLLISPPIGKESMAMTVDLKIKALDQPAVDALIHSSRTAGQKVAAPAR